MEQKEYVYESAVAHVNLTPCGFMVYDCEGLVPNVPVVAIESLESAIRNQGHATGVLKKIADDYEDCIILVKVSPPIDPEVVGKAEFRAKLEELIRFYENRGFCSINDYVRYECGEAMCYNNAHYAELRSAINDLLEK